MSFQAWLQGSPGPSFLPSLPPWEEWVGGGNLPLEEGWEEPWLTFASCLLQDLSQEIHSKPGELDGLLEQGQQLLEMVSGKCAQRGLLSSLKAVRAWLGGQAGPLGAATSAAEKKSTPSEGEGLGGAGRGQLSPSGHRAQGSSLGPPFSHFTRTTTLGGRPGRQRL